MGFETTNRHRVFFFSNNIINDLYDDAELETKGTDSIDEISSMAVDM